MPDPGNIAAIVLAAGSSRRFGSDKLLHPLARRGMTLPLAAHSLLPWLEIFGRVGVVVRPGAEMFCSAIDHALGAPNLRWIMCAAAGQGMAASLACGVRANSGADGWMIGLADMPAVPSTVIEGVRDALRDGANLSAAFCDGRRGHPAGFSMRYREELLALQGDLGARHLLERDRSDVIRVATGDNGIFADIDIPDDLHNL